jgi:hypothetical protein
MKNLFVLVFILCLNVTEAQFCFDAPITFSVGSTNRPYPLTVADFNGDGKKDLATCTTNDLYVYTGTGTGNFALSTFSYVGSGLNGIATGDFNADGKTDIAIAVYGFHNVALLNGNGSGGFSAPAYITVGANPNSLVRGDFNNDGKSDLAVANFGGGQHFCPSWHRHRQFHSCRNVFDVGWSGIYQYSGFQ